MRAALLIGLLAASPALAGGDAQCDAKPFTLGAPAKPASAAHKPVPAPTAAPKPKPKPPAAKPSNALIPCTTGKPK